MQYYRTTVPVKCAWSFWHQNGAAIPYWVYRSNGRPEVRYMELLDERGNLSGYWFHGQMNRETLKMWTIYVSMLSEDLIEKAHDQEGEDG